MSKRATRERFAEHRIAVRAQMCLDRPKPEYPDEAAALAAVAELRPDPPLYPYPCPRGHWHLTRQPPGEDPQ